MHIAVILAEIEPDQAPSAGRGTPPPGPGWHRATTDPEIDYEHLVVERNAPRWIRMLKQHGFLAEARAAVRA